MTSIIEILQLPFMQRALLGGLIVALLCALLGIFITLRKESFLSDAIAHASLSGVALAFLLALEPTPVALLVGMLMAVGITYVKKNSKLSADSIIGIFYAFLFAIGIILLNASPSYQPELATYLFGSILSVTSTDLIYAITVFVITLVVTMVLFRQLLYITLDQEAAYLRGIKVGVIEYILAILASVTIILSIKIVGIILVSALLIIPATTAKLTARSFSQMLPISFIQSLLSVIAGIFISFYLNTPTGATIVIVSGIIFGFAYLFYKIRN